MQPWLTITLAVLAVVGTIGGAWGGQWIAARRDDRRWEREAEREELRWTREIEARRAGEAHDLRKHWIDKRVEACSELLTVLKDWDMAFLNSLHVQEGSGFGDPTQVPFDEYGFHRQAMAGWLTLELIGSKEAISAVGFAVAAFGRCGNGDHDSSEQERVRTEMLKGRDFTEKLQQAMRRDLGLTKID
ncbi:hypothetical protein GCM10017567_31800 [Amycolatopsis bullii]|uniref:Secreted protein n=1 Tax=Amycolatopsis bullii TaxID=941987 RepID=A0ABQ3KF41_9PSEU|nr:hypothetical protein GCM10017567_31800 [Amycolatopsis bullii]